MWAVSPGDRAFHSRARTFASLFAFGISIVGGDLLMFISRNTDNLLIGVFLGPSPGLLRRRATDPRHEPDPAGRRCAPARLPVFLAAAAQRRAHAPCLRTYEPRERRADLARLHRPGAGRRKRSRSSSESNGRTASRSLQLLFLIGPVHTIQAFSGAVLGRGRTSRRQRCGFG